MENSLNKLLTRQLKRHFGSLDNLPDQLKGIILDISNTYENYEDDFQLLQNSIELSSQELRDAYQKHKNDADTQKETINKIYEAIYALNPSEQIKNNKKEQATTDSNFLFEALIKLIEDRKQAEEALNNERVLFRTIIDLIPDAVYVKDVEGRKILANPREVQFAGKEAENEIIGKTDSLLYPDEAAKRGLSEDQFVLQTGKSILEAEGSLIDKAGKHHWLQVSKVPLHDAHGKITGLVGVTHDISVRKETENELKQVSARLELATRAGGVGVWDLDFVKNTLLWDDQMFSLYGVTKFNFDVSYKTWIATIHPEEMEQVDCQIKKAIDGEKEFDTEFRVVWPGGTFRNIRALATIQRDNTGNPLHMIGTNWDITQQKETETTLLNAKQEADSANKAKSEFLTNMSHEIRTPLNGVIGFTELLLKTPLNKVQEQYSINANTSGHALLAIINDILDFSKIEAGKLELDRIKTDIIELAEQASDIIKYQASQKGLELLLNIQHDIPRNAIVDPKRLKQILVNLLGNAVKFTETGEVELKVTFSKTDEISGKFHFLVRDTGIGISEEQQSQLFRAFSQADNSTTRKFGGTGLGLTISNLLAEKMNSKIEIISQTDIGSSFFFTLETEYEAGKKADTVCLTEMNRLLVIDDNYNNRMILEHTCKDWGVEFVGVESCLSAIPLIEKSEPFDVIIVDYHMPHFNGLETIKIIREELNLTPEKQPVILLHSSSDDIGIYEECKKLGVVYNLTKPVKSNELLHYLKRIHNQPSASTFAAENITIEQPVGLVNNISPVILVVEDVVINMILITTLIRQMVPNAIVYEARNGKEALDQTISKNPDLIIMDIQMPVMSGIEATLAIREIEKGKGSRVPIVALTAGAIKGEMERCFEAGMDDFLTKPLDQNKLLRILGKYLSFIAQF
jgi:PAS domain S-box-containing protein